MGSLITFKAAVLQKYGPLLPCSSGSISGQGYPHASQVPEPGPFFTEQLQAHLAAPTLPGPQRNTCGVVPILSCGLCREQLSILSNYDGYHGKQQARSAHSLYRYRVCTSGAFCLAQCSRDAAGQAEPALAHGNLTGQMLAQLAAAPQPTSRGEHHMEQVLRYV